MSSRHVSTVPARVMIANVAPAIDGGRFAIKRVVGETVTVTADIFAEGHDELTAVLCVVNLDPQHAHSGWVDVPLDRLGLDAVQPYQVHELFGDARSLWHGSRNYVAIDPHAAPARVFRVRRRARTERDFDYFM